MTSAQPEVKCAVCNRHPTDAACRQRFIDEARKLRALCDEAAACFASLNDTYPLTEERRQDLVSRLLVAVHGPVPPETGTGGER